MLITHISINRFFFLKSDYFKTTIRSLCVVFFVHISTVDARHVAIEGSIAKESQYISEGRDNLEDGGIVSLEAVANWRSLTANIWLGIGDDVDYQEVNVGLLHNFEWQSIAGSIGYSRLAFLKSTENDNEFSFGISYNTAFWLIPSVDYVYSTQASGGYLELSLRSTVEFEEQRLIVAPYVTEGFDFGYASSTYDGPNHFQVGIDFAFDLSNKSSLVASINHSQPRTDVRRENLGEQTWFTVGLTKVF